MHAKPRWLPTGYKNWDALLTEPCARAWSGQSSRRCGAMELRKLARGRYRTPAGEVSALSAAWRAPAPQPLSGDTTTVKQVGRDFGPSQRFTMDWSNIDGSTENIVLGESSDPSALTSATSGTTSTAERPSRCPSRRLLWPRRPAHTLRLMP